MALNSREGHRAEIGHRLSAALKAVNEEIHRRLVASGYPDIRVGHGALFAHVEPGGTSVTELARRAGMTKQSMGELAADLESRGYVERVAHPGDRRARMVRLTKRGDTHVAHARQVIDELEGEYARALGVERFAELGRLLEELSSDRA